MRAKSFRPWRTNETWLLPPSVEEFGFHRGARLPPYGPGLMVALLLYAYSQGAATTRSAWMSDRSSNRLRATGWPVPTPTSATTGTARLMSGCRRRT